MTHRDPVRVTASVCSLARALSKTFTDFDHTSAIATQWPELIAVMIDRVDAFRARDGDKRFHHMRYRDLVGDPVGAVRDLYEHFDLGWNDDLARALHEHASVHKQNRFGEHKYSLEEFGLEAGPIRERMASYLEEFADYV
jgi:hypothetical protein